jgi:hypothetical protein
MLSRNRGISMSIAQLAHNIVSRLSDWWRDREDERLDELADQDYRHVNDEAAHSGVTAYQLIRKVRGGGKGA